MLHRNLGKTGLKVSIIGFGASPLGGEFGAIDPAEGKRAIHCAIDRGINYFDVAPYYGRTVAETRLGEFLEGKRDNTILATKACRYGRHLPDGFDFSAERVMKSVEESLSRLRTDVIDIYQIHDVEFGSKGQIIHDTLPAMQKLKEQGKVRFVGITGYPLNVLKEIASLAEVDTILSYCHYDLVNTAMDRLLTPFVREKGIGLINAAPLHMGVLTEKGPPSWHPAPREVLKRARRAAEWCQSRGQDITVLAMQFALQHKHVATTLVGMSEVSHVEENVAMVGVVPDEELLKEVLDMIKPAADLNWKEGLSENNDPGSINTRN